jgi:hypothetical protein
MLFMRDEVLWESGFYIFERLIAEEKEVNDFSRSDHFQKEDHNPAPPLPSYKSYH